MVCDPGLAPAAVEIFTSFRDKKAESLQCGCEKLSRTDGNDVIKIISGTIDLQMNSISQHHKRLIRVTTGSEAGFTLIELLVVITIIAAMISMLLPSLAAVRHQTRSLKCQSQLYSMIQGFHVYSLQNNDQIIPSYNMFGVSTSTHPMDGWGPILDHLGIVMGNGVFDRNPYTCPETLDRPGIQATQTGSDPDNPKGYMDCPAMITISTIYAAQVPFENYRKTIRTGYWINGDNPIGIPQEFTPGIFYTSSVGYGPNLQNQVMMPNSYSRFRTMSRLIALADGLYSGKQEFTRVGVTDSRIGYRHPVQGKGANAAIADGHVEAVDGQRFPRKYAPGWVTAEEARLDNMGTGLTIYADPEQHIPES
ncbi:MAG: hypothetical protein HJJLKODD_01179 [Phycisphaerae bacterium]|nr:hypothetical protein [Phycisphaerae bacterium]